MRRVQRGRIFKTTHVSGLYSIGGLAVSVVHAGIHAGIHASVDTLSEIFQQRFYPLSVGISSPNFQDILVA